MPSWTKGFPFRENCAPTDPFEAFLWMLVALPGQRGAPLVRAPSYLQLVSERLWQLGCRPNEEPQLTYRIPQKMDPNWATSAGTWVTGDGRPARIDIPASPWRQGFPLRGTCNPDDPFEVFLWMLVALPEQEGPPLVYPAQYLQLVSKRLWDLGVRHTEPPALVYQAPTWAEPNIYSNPGRWAPVGDGEMARQ